MPATMDDLHTGDLVLTYQERTFTPVSCGGHTKQREHIGTNCPACQNPAASAITGRGPAHIEDVEYATEDGKTGYRPNCEGCAATAAATLEYVSGLEFNGDLVVVSP